MCHRDPGLLTTLILLFKDIPAFFLVQQYLTVPAVLFGLAVVQAYELLQGNLVRFSPDAQTKDVPTAVLVHGILGSKRNLNSFARMLVGVSNSKHVSCSALSTTCSKNNSSYLCQTSSLRCCWKVAADTCPVCLSCTP